MSQEVTMSRQGANTRKLKNRSVRGLKRLAILAGAVAGVGLAANAASAANIWWDGASASWNTNTNWSTVSGATTPDPSAVAGSADNAIFNITTANSNETITLDAGQSALGLTFNSTGTTAINTGTGTNLLSIGAGGLNLNNGAGAVTFGAGVTVAANQTWTISTTASATRLTTGALALNGNLTLAGLGNAGMAGFYGTSSSGALTLGTISQDSIARSLTVNLAPTAVVQLAAPQATGWSGGTTIRGGTLAIVTSATADYTGSILGTGPVTLNGGALRFTGGAYGRLLTATNDISIGANGGVIEQADTAGNYPSYVTMSGTISGSAPVTLRIGKTNFGTTSLTISGTNSGFKGGYKLASVDGGLGVIQFANAGSLGDAANRIDVPAGVAFGFASGVGSGSWMPTSTDLGTRFHVDSGGESIFTIPLSGGGNANLDLSTATGLGLDVRVSNNLAYTWSNGVTNYAGTIKPYSNTVKLTSLANPNTDAGAAFNLTGTNQITSTYNLDVAAAAPSPDQVRFRACIIQINNGQNFSGTTAVSGIIGTAIYASGSDQTYSGLITGITANVNGSLSNTSSVTVNKGATLTFGGGGGAPAATTILVEGAATLTNGGSAKLLNTAALTLGSSTFGGGTFTNSQTQVLASVTANRGRSTLGGASGLTVSSGAIARNAGSALTISNTAVTLSGATASNFLSPGLFVGSNFAAVNGSGLVLAAAPNSNDITSPGVDFQNTAGGSYSLTSANAVNTLTLNSANNIDVGASTLTVSGGGIIASGGARSIAASAGGTLTSAYGIMAGDSSTRAELVINDQGTTGTGASLTIAPQIAAYVDGSSASHNVTITKIGDTNTVFSNTGSQAISGINVLQGNVVMNGTWQDGPIFLSSGMGRAAGNNPMGLVMQAPSGQSFASSTSITVAPAGGALIQNVAGQTTTFNGNVNLQGALGVYGISYGGGTFSAGGKGTLALNGNISGPGVIGFGDPGTAGGKFILQLSGDNANAIAPWTGGLTYNGGTQTFGYALSAAGTDYAQVRVSPASASYNPLGTGQVVSVLGVRSNGNALNALSWTSIVFDTNTVGATSYANDFLFNAATTPIVTWGLGQGLGSTGGGIAATTLSGRIMGSTAAVFQGYATDDTHVSELVLSGKLDLTGTGGGYSYGTSSTAQNFNTGAGGITLGVTNYKGTTAVNSNALIDLPGSTQATNGAMGFVRFATPDSFIPGADGTGYIAAIRRAGLTGSTGGDSDPNAGRFGYLVTGTSTGQSFALPQGKSFVVGSLGSGTQVGGTIGTTHDNDVPANTYTATLVGSTKARAGQTIAGFAGGDINIHANGASDNQSLNLLARASNDTLVLGTSANPVVFTPTTGDSGSATTTTLMSKRMGTTTLNKIGSGTVKFAGVQFTHTDGTDASSSFAINVNAGKLITQTTANSAAINVNSGGTLGGTGSIGALSLAGGGTYTWTVSNTGGPAGTGYDKLISSGNVNITASSATPFTIDITGLTSGGAIGAVPSFNNAATYQWNILSAASTISLDPSAFTLATSNFATANPLNGGQFHIVRGDDASITGGTDSQIYLTYGPSGVNEWAPSGSANWAATGSWSAGTIPDGNTAAARLWANLTSNNTGPDLQSTDRTVNLLSFKNTAASYLISSSGGGKLIFNSASGNATMQFEAANTRDHAISAPVTFAVSTDATLGSNALTLSGSLAWGSSSAATLALHTGTLNLSPAASTSATVYAGSALSIDPGATVNVNAASADPFTGSGNSVAITNASATGLNITAGSTTIASLAGAGNTSVSSSATLRVSGAASQNQLTVDGHFYPSSSGVGVTTLAGAGTVHGNVTLASGGAVNLGSTGNITGTLAASNGSWTGSGSVGGTTTISSGTFTVAGSASLGGAGGITVNPGANLTVTGSTGPSQTITNSGTLAGTGNIQGSVNNTGGTLRSTTILNIGGTLSLSGTSSLTTGTVAVAGATTVTSGAFTISSGAALTSGGVTVNPNATLSGGGSIGGNVGIAAGGTIQPHTTSTGTALLTLTSGDLTLHSGAGLNYNFSGSPSASDLVSVNSGAVSVLSDSSAHQTLNVSYVNGFWPNPYASYNLIYAFNGVTNAGTWDVTGLPAGTGYSVGVDNTGNYLVLNISTVPAQPYYFAATAATATWGDASKWSTASDAATPNPGSPPGASNIAVFNISTYNSSNNNKTVTLDAPRAATALQFASASTVTINSGTGGSASTLTIGNASYPGSGISVASGAGTVTINAPVVLNADQTWTNNSSSTVTLAGGVTAPSAYNVSVTAGKFTLSTNPVALSGALSTSNSAVLTVSGQNANAASGALASQINLGGTSTLVIAQTGTASAWQTFAVPIVVSTTGAVNNLNGGNGNSNLQWYGQTATQYLAISTLKMNAGASFAVDQWYIGNTLRFDTIELDGSGSTITTDSMNFKSIINNPSSPGTARSINLSYANNNAQFTFDGSFASNVTVNVNSGNGSTLASGFNLNNGTLSLVRGALNVNTDPGSGTIQSNTSINNGTGVNLYNNRDGSAGSTGWGGSTTIKLGYAATGGGPATLTAYVRETDSDTKTDANAHTTGGTPLSGPITNVINTDIIVQAGAPSGNDASINPALSGDDVAGFKSLVHFTKVELSSGAKLYIEPDSHINIRTDLVLSGTSIVQVAPNTFGSYYIGDVTGAGTVQLRNVNDAQYDPRLDGTLNAGTEVKALSKFNTTLDTGFRLNGGTYSMDTIAGVTVNGGTDTYLYSNPTAEGQSGGTINNTSTAGNALSIYTNQDGSAGTAGWGTNVTINTSRGRTTRIYVNDDATNKFVGTMAVQHNSGDTAGNVDAIISVYHGATGTSQGTVSLPDLSLGDGSRTRFQNDSGAASATFVVTPTLTGNAAIDDNLTAGANLSIGDVAGSGFALTVLGASSASKAQLVGALSTNVNVGRTSPSGVAGYATLATGFDLNGQTLTIVNGGVDVAAGVTASNGTLTLSTGGALKLFTNDDIAGAALNLNGGTLQFDSAVTSLTAATININASHAAVAGVAYNSGSDFNINGPAIFTTSAAAGSVYNAVGNVNIATGATLRVAGPTSGSNWTVGGGIRNSGTVQVNSGTFDIGSKLITNAGVGSQVQVAPGATLDAAGLSADTLALTTTGTLAANVPTVSLNASASQSDTAGSFSLNRAAGALTYDGTLSLGANNSLAVGAFSLAGGTQLSKTGAGTLTVTGAQTHGSGASLSVAGGTVNLDSDAGSASAANLAVSVSAGQVKLGHDQHLGSVTTTHGAGTLDLAGHSLVVKTGDVAALSSQIAAGDIFTSSTIDANHGIGITTGQLAIDHGNSTFMGEPISGTAVLIQYGWNGDLNMDGNVDYLDYGVIDNAYLNPATPRNYANGDINLDGVINYLDYGLMDNAYLAQSAPHLAASAASFSAVPEPAAVGLLAMGALGLVARRRRN